MLILNLIYEISSLDASSDTFSYPDSYFLTFIYNEKDCF